MHEYEFEQRVAFSDQKLEPLQIVELKTLLASFPCCSTLKTKLESVSAFLKLDLKQYDPNLLKIAANSYYTDYSVLGIVADTPSRVDTVSAAQKLLEIGAVIDIKDRDGGRSAIHWVVAAKPFSSEMLDVFLNGGASLDGGGYHRMTVLEFAQYKDNDVAVEQIEKELAKREAAALVTASEKGLGIGPQRAEMGKEIAESGASKSGVISLVGQEIDGAAIGSGP